jgi:hypothetical protein
MSVTITETNVPNYERALNVVNDEYLSYSVHFHAITGWTLCFADGEGVSLVISEQDAFTLLAVWKQYEDERMLAPTEVL